MRVGTASVHRSTKDAHVVAAGDLSGLLRCEAATQHRRDEMHPLLVVLHATRRDMLVSTNADVIDADDIDDLLQAVDILYQARKEVPDADRTARFCDCSRMILTDLPAGQWCRAHCPRSGERGM